MIPIAPSPEPSSTEAEGATVATYLIRRLTELGVRHLFGVPGDFVLGLLNEVLKSELTFVGTCTELNAAYAADGYARLAGLGALATTFGVGELSAINGVAGAFAECVPLVVITGSPTTTAFQSRPLLHHTLGDFAIPRQLYERITVASTQLTSGETAGAEIDRVLRACLAHRRPVYISVPSDLVLAPCAWTGPLTRTAAPTSDAGALKEALDEAAARLESAAQPVIIAGASLVRFGHQAALSALLDASGYPYATMMLGKCVLSEFHPQFIGLFEGDRSRPYVQSRLRGADVVLELGEWLTDFNTGGFTTGLDPARTIRAEHDVVRIGSHAYENVQLVDFITGLAARLSHRDVSTLYVQAATTACTHRATVSYAPEADRPVTVARLFDRLSHFIEPGAVVLADTGVSLFAAAETLMPDGVTFIGQTFYGSIGYTVGAALGAAIAAPDRRVLLLVGDGAFQMTSDAVSTMVRTGANVTIVLLNNDGYTIERVICDRPYNDIQPWQYHKLMGVYGGGLGLDVRTEGELDTALRLASTASGVVLIEVHTERMDCPESLRRAGQTMATSNHLQA